MALGTTLSGSGAISTTGGIHALAFNGDGVAAANEWQDNQDIFYVCLMSYNDYSNVAPVQDGDHTQIYLRYTEYSGTGSDPRLSLVNIDSSLVTVYARTSGNDDDATLANVTTDGSVSWDTIRGDADTTGTNRNATATQNYFGIFTTKFTGRGADVITDNRRSYFAFDGSVLNPAKTIASCKIEFYADNYGHTNDDFGKIIAVQATTLAGSTADYGNCFVADAVTVTDNATFFGANF